MNNKQLLVLTSTVLSLERLDVNLQLIKMQDLTYNPIPIAMGTVAWDMGPIQRW